MTSSLARQSKDAALNFSNWSSIFATRKFPRQLLQQPISQRHVSKFLTFPYTIASLLSRPWLYYSEEMEKEKKNPVTEQGWHALSSLSHSLDVAVKQVRAQEYHPKPGSQLSIFSYQITAPKSETRLFSEEASAPLLTNDPFRVFIYTQRNQPLDHLPVHVWEQLSLTFPGVPFRLYFFGEDLKLSREELLNAHWTMYSRPRGYFHQPLHYEKSINDEKLQVFPISINLQLNFFNLTSETDRQNEQLEQFFQHFKGTFKPNRDCFFLFNTFLSHEKNQAKTRKLFEQILDTKCLLTVTSPSQYIQERDYQFIQSQLSQKMKDGLDFIEVMRPCWNKFSSLEMELPVDQLQLLAKDKERFFMFSNARWMTFKGIGKELEKHSEHLIMEKDEQKKWLLF